MIAMRIASRGAGASGGRAQIILSVLTWFLSPPPRPVSPCDPSDPSQALHKEGMERLHGDLYYSLRVFFCANKCQKTTHRGEGVLFLTGAAVTSSESAFICSESHSTVKTLSYIQFQPHRIGFVIPGCFWSSESSFRHIKTI